LRIIIFAKGVCVQEGFCAEEVECFVMSGKWRGRVWGHLWGSSGGDSFSKTKIILAECDEWQVTTRASAFPTASPLSFSFSA